MESGFLRGAPADADAIPLIDLQKFREGSEAERLQVAQQFDEAFRTVGFCCVENYDAVLPESAVVQRLRAESLRWFAMSTAQKRTAYADGMIGYIGQGHENVAASTGDHSNDPDLVESLNFPGYQEPGAGWVADVTNHPGKGTDSTAAQPQQANDDSLGRTASPDSSGGDVALEDKADRPGESSQLTIPWADCPWLGDACHQRLCKAAKAYWVGATQLMFELQSLAELALGLPTGFFDASYRRPGTLLRLAFYPPTVGSSVFSDNSGAEESGQIEPPTAWRYGAHTDYDGFTILQRAEFGDSSADNEGSEDASGTEESSSESPSTVPAGRSVTGGLEIEMPDGSWRAVPARKGTLTINIGDLMARWTNDRWKATRHRVAPPPPNSRAASKARLSIVYFTGPHPDTVIECLPCASCKPNDGSEPKYPPITAADHVQAKIHAATAAGIAANAESEAKESVAAAATAAEANK